MYILNKPVRIALTGDGRSLEVAAAGADAVVLMHMRGEPATMNLDPAYEDAPLDVYDFLEDRVEACVAAGIERGVRLLVPLPDHERGAVDGRRVEPEPGGQTADETRLAAAQRAQQPAHRTRVEVKE